MQITATQQIPGGRNCWDLPGLIPSQASHHLLGAAKLAEPLKGGEVPQLADLREAQKHARTAVEILSESITSADQFSVRNAQMALDQAQTGLTELSRVVTHLTPGIIKPMVHYTDEQLVGMLNSSTEAFLQAEGNLWLESA